MLSPLVTLFGSILALVAIGLIPGKTAIKEGKMERYFSWGKGAIFVLAVAILGIGGYVIYSANSNGEWDAFSTGNIALFLGIGVGLVVNNIWLMRKLKASQVPAGDEAIEVEAVEVEEVREETEEKAPAAPVKKVPTKKVKKAVQKTPTVAQKQVVRPAPVKKVVKEPEVETPPVDKCPFCDTSLDYLQDGKCPVCGEHIDL